MSEPTQPDSTKRVYKHWQFKPGDPRRINRPLGPNKTTLAAQALLREQLLPKVQQLIDLSEAVAKDAPPCPLCSRGMPRSESFQLTAITTILDRAGIGPSSKVEVQQPADDGWVDFTTDEEAELLYDIMARARQRMAAEAEPQQETVS